MTLFVDMDGVLADFDKHYAQHIGPVLPRTAPARAVQWIKLTGSWWAGIPPMEDMKDLWAFVSHRNPTILTGVPMIHRAEVISSKKEWVRKHLGAHVPVITCSSSGKSSYCQNGDILIDDWEKYRHLWEQKGGVWVTHTSAKTTIEELIRLGL